MYTHLRLHAFITAHNFMNIIFNLFIHSRAVESAIAR